MALTAPRYDSTGASVGSMPVPQVKADTSLADSLQAVGDTFASVGKSVGAMMKFKQDADETAAADIGLTLDQRLKAVHDDFSTQEAGNAVSKYADYQEKLKAVNVDDLLEGKSQGVRDALAKRERYRRMYYETGMQTHFTLENKKYIFDTADKEYKQGMQTAIAAHATADADPQTLDTIKNSTAQAWSALQRRSDVKGEKADPEQMMADIRMGALHMVAQTNDPRKIVRVYDKFAGKFGPYEVQAKAMAQDANDTMYVQDVAIPAMQAVNGGGNFNADAVLSTVSKTLGKQSDAVQEKMQKAAAFLEKQDYQARAALGDQMAAEADMARLQGQDATEMMKQKVNAWAWRLHFPDAVRITSLLAGGATGLPEHNAEVKAIIDAGTPAAMEQLRDALNKHKYALSADMTRQAQAALAGFEDTHAKKIAAAREQVFKMIEQDDPAGRKIVMPGSKEDGLDSSEQEYYTASKKIVDDTIAELGGTGKADSIKDLQVAYAMAKGKMRTASPGLIWGGNRMVPYSQLSSRPAAEREYVQRQVAAGRRADDIPASEISLGATAIQEQATQDANRRAEAGAKAWDAWQRAERDQRWYATAPKPYAEWAEGR